MYSYNSFGEDRAIGGYGGGSGIILLFVFLLILFAVFRGGFGGHDGGHANAGGYDGHGRGCGSIADFEAIAQNNQRVPEEQVQLAKDFGAVKEKITMGNFEISKQISDTAMSQQLQNCQDEKAELRQQLTESKFENGNLKNTLFLTEKFGVLSSRLDNIECHMLRKPQVQALAGFPELQCSNIPNGFLNNGCGC